MTQEKKIDFDFSNITKSIQEKKEKKQEIKSEPPKKRLSGIMLTIQSQVPSQFISCDLTECSPDTFVAWIAQVYPDPELMKRVDLFEKEVNRLDIFKKIVNFHRTLHIKGDQNQKKKLETNA